MDLYLREGGANRSTRRKPPTTSPKIGIAVILEVTIHSPKSGIEPSPSNISDKFAWSERAGSNQLIRATYSYTSVSLPFPNVSRLGLVVRPSAGKRKDAVSTPRFGSPFSSPKNVIYGHCIVTLPCTSNETLKWLTS